jgi:tripartite-type tricarboxylate transporter receptor subunit TctC
MGAFIATALGALFAVTATRADPISDFYQGRQINLILSTGDGGGYSSYARAFAPYLTKHLPGHPSIIVQSMPGAGGIRAMLYLASVAPRDGSTIGMVHAGVPFAPIFGIRGATFDPRQMHWLGGMSRAPGVCIAWRDSGIATWDDLLTKEFIVGSSGVGSQMETYPSALIKLYGAKIKIVSGYKSGTDVYIAMERGEVHGRCASAISSIELTRPGWVREGKVTVPILFDMQRAADLPGVPTVMELAPSDLVKQIMELMLAPQEMNRPMVAPPGVPPERVAALRAAFHAAINDPGFLADAKKQLLEIEENTAERVTDVIARAYAMPPEVIKATKEAMNFPGSMPE